MIGAVVGGWLVGSWGSAGWLVGGPWSVVGWSVVLRKPVKNGNKLLIINDLLDDGSTYI